MRAEDTLPDHANTATFNGMTVRKGTIAAFLNNAKVFADEDASPTARASAERDIVDALPALSAVGLFEVMEVRDAQVQALVQAHAAALQSFDPASPGTKKAPV